MSEKILSLQDRRGQREEAGNAGGAPACGAGDGLRDDSWLPELIDVEAPARPRDSRIAKIALAAAVVLAGAAVYGANMAWKSFQRQDSPLPLMGRAAPWKVPAAAAPAASEPHALTPDQIGGMTERLRARLAQQPDNAEGWAMLGRTYAVMGKPDDAVPAFAKAAALRDGDAVLLADYADALAASRGRSFEGEPIKLIARALKIAPDNLKALSMAGSAAYDRKDFVGAVAYWERLQRAAPADSVFVKQIEPQMRQARQQLQQHPVKLASQ